ncbi:hypothetical protein A3H65_03195 [Candidatus Giovannonibacteria bacterium RIFCSPLOWO2_02_FULL_45_14]|uniref:Endolytic murein transglycosylase n=1 Tax=Candidatus Giovannonibacteria bacterium RIFCSPLOWO2_12_FULL_44_15 TaxID=1798364 RepID=A0A1F5Y0Y1_9BACT|nr:MAG: hypothetical protein A3C75_00375 [Candidatus Giovannonibacteria bacterium RIFCSPHIGHO2_02_FULL_44_31]OGF77025.1 MAG: hypothetical protein A3E62_04145 [Candidatus Giovannonibacteria bacterium RIFCSPHIGHO2_12_FULL_44_29]OGF90803.1 MAG: hypothetical protein A3H65_03195 [Candidatus Giovannonibacteria bacterium RIFCSPLOWO2_02_FULL_45_14]OGF93858.1 MAG: hypothetical protein A3G54_03810 [Candidatus Giovannonibacteria bacterium RIFCSPLOWO2_12_FULL_44_15]
MPIWKELKIAALGTILIFLIFLLYWYSSKEPAPAPAETISVTIPEGFNVYQIATALESAGIVGRDEFLKEAVSEEGFLFPDTYEFFKDSKPKVIAAKIKRNFEEKTAIFESEIARQKKEMRDIVIMASLLEEEAASEKDRKIISGILWRRISLGMPLQVDAALTYATGRSSHKLTDADLVLDDPYNTYKYKGLPVGPISNPGIGAIEAAINPTISAYLYYLSDSKGVIHYAKTFEEHKLNRTKYLR